MTAGSNERRPTDDGRPTGDHRPTGDERPTGDRRPTGDGPLRGRRLLVTGASAGIGAATARAIVAAGGRVALLARSRDALDALREELLRQGDTTAAGERSEAAVVVAADVVDPDAARNAVDMAAERLGGLDGVINAAGGARPGPIATTSPADWQLMLDVNVRGLLHVTQAALPHLREAATAAADRDGSDPAGGTGVAPAGDGSAPAGGTGVADIVNVSSMSGRRVGSPAMGVYAASKAAVHALSGALRSEVAGDGVRVSVIAPGFVRTGIFEGQDSDAARRLGAKGQQVGLEPEQVAARIVEVLAAPPGLMHVEVAMVSLDQAG